jgi:hypothetical protein
MKLEKFGGLNIRTPKVEVFLKRLANIFIWCWKKKYTIGLLKVKEMRY